MKRGKTYEWIPLWVEKWLWGSTRIELTPAERSVWVDLMALGSKDDGYIRANEMTPYLDAQLAGMLCVPIELLQTTIAKCIEYGKLGRDNQGTLYILNWAEYSLTERHKRRVMSAKSDTHVRVSGPTSMSMSKSKSSSNTKEEEILKAWNDFATLHGLAPIKGIPSGSARERSLKARLAAGLDFIGLLDEIARAPFLLGQKTDFRATFDWVLKPSNHQKIIEGNYRGPGPKVDVGSTPIDKDAAVRRAVERNRKNFPELKED